MIIVDEVTGILEAMRQDTLSPLQSWQYNSPARVNVENDYTKTPTAVMYCLTDWEVTFTTVRERASVAVGFLTLQPNIDFDGLENDTRVEQTKDIALDFVRRVHEGGVLRIEDDTIRIRSIYDMDDRNLTGVFLEITLLEVQGQCLDSYAPDEPDENP